jgi:transcriptional regulator with XRE-family HTH domain
MLPVSADLADVEPVLNRRWEAGICTVPASVGPALRRRRLASELRQLRERAGLTLAEVAQELEWSAAKISRIENAHVSVLPRDVRFLLGIYGTADSSDRDRLVALARESRQKPWWHRYGVSAVPIRSQAFAALEAEAAVSYSYHPELVPALLQTPAYHHAVQQATLSVPDGEDGNEMAALLRARQDRRAATGTPHLHAILSETVIRRPAGGSAVMAAQLDHLAGAAALGGVTVQVLPFAAGAHPALDAPLTLMTFPDPDDPDIACTGPHGALCLDADADVQHYRHAFTGLKNMALTATDSLALITQATAEFARQPAAAPRHGAAHAAR